MKNKLPILAISLSLLLAVSIASLLFGPSGLTPLELWQGIAGENQGALAILLYIRLPRLLAAILAGAGLSVSGLLLQTVLSNGLASPNTIGVNSGAGLFTVGLLALFPQWASYCAPVAFLGSLLALGAILLLTGRARMGEGAVLLGGIAVSAFFGAGISFFTVLFPDVLLEYNVFSIGTLSGVSLASLWLPAIFIVLSLCAALILAPAIGALRLGNGVAGSLGVNVPLTRTLALILACLSGACVVSFAGLLGFVGLLVPHGIRYFVKTDLRLQLLLCPVFGGILVTLSDLLGRCLFAPSELPVGMLMAAVGAPFFAVLLLKRRGRNAYL